MAAVCPVDVEVVIRWSAGQTRASGGTDLLDRLMNDLRIPTTDFPSPTPAERKPPKS